jgi:hypothetical protein
LNPSQKAESKETSIMSNSNNLERVEVIAYTVNGKWIGTIVDLDEGGLMMSPAFEWVSVVHMSDKGLQRINAAVPIENLTGKVTIHIPPGTVLLYKKDLGAEDQKIWDEWIKDATNNQDAVRAKRSNILISRQ